MVNNSNIEWLNKINDFPCFSRFLDVIFVSEISNYCFQILQHSRPFHAEPRLDDHSVSPIIFFEKIDTLSIEEKLKEILSKPSQLPTSRTLRSAVRLIIPQCRLYPTIAKKGVSFLRLSAQSHLF